MCRDGPKRASPEGALSRDLLILCVCLIRIFSTWEEEEQGAHVVYNCAVGVEKNAVSTNNIYIYLLITILVQNIKYTYIYILCVF